MDKYLHVDGFPKEGNAHDIDSVAQVLNAEIRTDVNRGALASKRRYRFPYEASETTTRKVAQTQNKHWAST